MNGLLIGLIDKFFLSVVFSLKEFEISLGRDIKRFLPIRHDNSLKVLKYDIKNYKISGG